MKINTKKLFILDSKIILGLLVTAVILWTASLGGLPLRDWDEGYYATVSKDMFRQGNWLYPTYLGEPFLLKPPLIFWLISMSYYLGGISEFTARLPCALLTAWGVPLLYLLGREVFPSRLPAVLAAAVYLTLLPVVRHGRLAMLDGMVNTFLLLSFLCLLKGRRSPRWLVGVGVGLGLIALAKGLLVVALATIILGFIVVDRQAKILSNPYLWLGFFLGFIPAVTWYFIQWHHYGHLFLQVHFQQQSLNRLSTAVEGNRGPIWYYAIELVKYTLPWLLFLPGALNLAWQRRHQTWGILVLVSMGIYLGLISLMTTKLPWYLLPVYPFFALAVGAYLAQLWNSPKQHPPLLAALMVMLGVVALGGSVYFTIGGDRPVLVLMSIVLGATLVLSGLRLKQKDKKFIPILSIGLYATLILFVSSQDWIWELNEAFPVRPVASLIEDRVPPNQVVYTSFAYSRPSLDFYSDRKVVAADGDTLEQLATEKAYLLLDRSALDNLQLSNGLSLGKAGEFTLVLSQPENRDLTR